MNRSSITSRQNPRIKNVVRLRERREREKQRRFLIDGAREILRAIQGNVPCIEAFFCEALIDSDEGRDALEALRATGAELHSVTVEVYQKVAFGQRDDGLVVVGATPERQLSQIVLGPTPLVAVLEGIEKPGNVGAILRSADGAGVDGVVVVEGRTDLYNPNTIRASLGTVFSPNICEATTAETLEWLQERDLSIVATRPDAEGLYTDVDLRGGTAIILGSEAHGLSGAWEDAKVEPIRLPMLGLADSLNVSTTAAVLFYEAVRQRGIRRGV